MNSEQFARTAKSSLHPSNYKPRTPLLFYQTAMFSPVHPTRSADVFIRQSGASSFYVWFTLAIGDPSLILSHPGVWLTWCFASWTLLFLFHKLDLHDFDWDEIRWKLWICMEIVVMDCCSWLPLDEPEATEETLRNYLLRRTGNFPKHLLQYQLKGILANYLRKNVKIIRSYYNRYWDFCPS